MGIDERRVAGRLSKSTYQIYQSTYFTYQKLRATRPLLVDSFYLSVVEVLIDVIVVVLYHFFCIIFCSCF